MTEARRQFLEKVLDALEEQESALLVWGVVDGSFSVLEMGQVIDPLIDNALEEKGGGFFDSATVIEELLNHKWIVEVEGQDDGERYRSRMAETVRLLHRLRQLFPKHARTDLGWQSASTLVADFRFLRRRRQYPRRGVTLTEVLKSVRTVTSDPSIHKGLQALIESSPSLKSSGLANFQVRATNRILNAIESDKPLATIVCAGTGSGKTLAFYLPALASIVRHHIKEPQHAPWVKVVAIYPRNELLKDQLREVLSRVLNLGKHLQINPKPIIRIGALFSDLQSASPTKLKDKFKWPKRGHDYACPILRCLECNSELHWKNDDFIQGIERLECSSTACDFSLDGEIFPLTRESLAKRPPDILFSTTEMLNRRLSDNKYGHLFGCFKAQRAPELVLLDEVHTYEGRHGAQVAYLMRRWRRALRHPLRFVGLSATLRESTSFFSSLTGVGFGWVDEISPKSDELIQEGAEYMLALRGDPVSRAALLSTTIQSAMLLRRCLDPREIRLENSVSRGLFGQRAFVFTDDLDVTNRLYFNLLDAEGRDSKGRPNMVRAPDGGLAVLRRSGMSQLRYLGGQDWRSCESLNHQLDSRLVIERVSSQDRGVNQDADIVVATAALEVGFDDPMVGAVIQHKAPRGIAGYLQRKGRAGRLRGMRPWMVIVLSDYGRDRNAYQNYDILFDPELPVRTLPLSNRYITRMQAVYGTIDYLGQCLQSASQGSVWDDLTKPPWPKDRKEKLIKELRSILESESGAQKLAYYLRGALKMSDSEILSLLWEYPRPLLTSVIPTAIRRLETDWRANGETDTDFKIKFCPLPDFVPGSLFDDLNLAEVAIELPASNSSEAQAMPLISALREFAPGRVSRRFGVRHGSERYWIPPGDDFSSDCTIAKVNLEVIGRVVKVGEFSFRQDKNVLNVPVYRPTRIDPQVPPKTISDTSNSRLCWHSQLVPLRSPDWLKVPTENTWGEIINSIGFFLHASHGPVEVRRFATGSIAEVGIGKERRRINVEFEQAESLAGLGVAFTADGVAFQISIPKTLYEIGIGSAEKWRGLRTTRFVDEAWRGISIPTIASPFLREWLAQIQLTSIAYEAVSQQKSLEQAAQAVLNDTASIKLEDVLKILFQSQVVDLEDEDISLGGEDKLRRELETLVKDPAVRSSLFEASKILWNPISEGWGDWLSRVYQTTIGCALLRAVCDLCPTIDPSDLVMDLERGPEILASSELRDPRLKEIWITEQGPGGNGLIEEFMRKYAEDPRGFFSMVRASLEMGEFELIDFQFARLLEILGSDKERSGLKDTVQKMRQTESLSELGRLSKDLRIAMVKEGFSPFHGFMVAVANRVMRPGSGPATDAYLESALSKWKTEEKRLGIEIDLRVLTYLLSQTQDIDAVVSEVGIPDGMDRGAWRMSAISGLLWGRGRAIRQAPLQVRHPYTELPPIERLLVLESIGDTRLKVSVEREDWLKIASNYLSDGKLVTLLCEESGREGLGKAIEALICNPIESGYIRAYARLQGIRQCGNIIEADVELVEGLQ